MELGVVRQCFERGSRWALAHAEGLSPDARLAVLAALLLTDPDKAESVRASLRGPRKIRLSALGRLIDVLSLGAASRRRRREAERADAFFALIERDPKPLTWSDLDSFRSDSGPLPNDPDALHRIDGPHSNAALVQASLGQLEEPVLVWLRRDDLWGYDLAHQLLAWVVCLKKGYRTEEARERAGHLSWRLFHEIQRSPAVHFDLFVERIAFLLLAGFPVERLTEQIQDVVALQDPADGGWWFTRRPAEQAAMIENAHLGASPLVRPARSYRERADPEAARRRLEILHRGHSTGLSLWALGYWLRQAATTSTQGLSDETPASSRAVLD